MRIAYCTNVRLPSERAHGHQVARVCDALTALGHEVYIFAPFRNNPIAEKYGDFHLADSRVKIEYLGKFDPIDSRYLPEFLQLSLLNFLLRWNLQRRLKRGRFDLLYTRTPALLSMLLQTNTPVILELHTLPRRGKRMFVEQCNSCACIACLTTPMRNELVSWGVRAPKVSIEPDAVDVSKFVHPEPLSLEIPPRPRIAYVGQIESMGLSKGIPELLNALDTLRRRGNVCYGAIAGPMPKNDDLLKRLRRTPYIHYFDFLPWESIPSFLADCDILVYPAPASDHPFFQRDTSPLKIFEYMAARKPIVAADLPPLRDILSEETAFLCKPGDPQSLADAIERALKHPEEAQAKVERAWQVVQEHTWEKRMQRILYAFSRQE